MVRFEAGKVAVGKKAWHPNKLAEVWLHLVPWAHIIVPKIRPAAPLGFN